MKKFTLLLILTLTSFCLRAQEGFEGVFPPPGWGIFQNNVGLGNTWVQSPANSTALPPHTGAHAAYLDRVNVSSGIPEDWLVMPATTVPANPQLRFWSRLTQPGPQGSIYQIRISSNVAAGQQGVMANYTIIQTWTEAEINPAQQEYIEKIVTLPASAIGTQVHIAFVMLGDNGDRWLIDDVSVVEQCLDPENLTATGITETSANLSWDNPGSATSWEIEVLPSSSPQTGTGVTYNGALPYVATPLTEDTDYKYYVRALCANGSESEWVGPFFFSTVAPGATCESAFDVLSLPFSDTDTTQNFGNNYEGSPGNGCGSTNSYLSGNDVVYVYTPVANQIISATLSEISGTYAGLFVYTSCANIGVNCFAGNVNGSSTDDIELGQLSLIANTTYYFVISTWPFPDSTGYTLTLQAENCAKPTNLTATGATTSGVTLNWTEAGTATSWEYVTQPIGSGIPAGSGTTANATSLPLTGLPDSTGFEFYVRANCGNGTFSAWSGPITYNTLCETLQLPFSESFNTNSTTEFCWTVLNENGDDDSWNMDYQFDTFEGDQVAVLNTDGNNGDNDDWLISPTINLTGAKRLKYRFRGQSSFEPDAFEVLFSTTGIDPEDFTITLSPLATHNNTDYVEVIVNLVNGSNVPYTGPVNIAWHVPAGGPDGWRLFIDQVIIEDIPSCPDPTALTVADITTTTAQLSWSPGFNETSWQVVVQPAGTGEPAATAGGTPITQNPYPATGLNPSTQYEYYVRAYCAANDQSEWVGPVTFNTLCEALPVPFYEGFNSDSATEFCWTVLDVNGDGDTWNLDTNFNQFEGDQVAQMNTDFNFGADNDWLISPTINITGGAHRLKFHYSVQSSFEPNAMEVLLSTTGADPSDFTIQLVPLQEYDNTEYDQYIINLLDGSGNPYTGNVNIAFHVPPGGPDGWNLYIDNVIVEPIPSCPDPTDLEASNFTTTSAELTWQPGYQETQWQVVVQPQGTGIPAATAGGTPFSDNPHIATGLNPSTQYEYYVRAYCAADDQSLWVGPFLFTTLCEALPTPFYEGFNSDSSTEFCWTVLNENGDDRFWNMDLDFNQYEGDQVAQINTDFTNGDNDDWLISPTLIIQPNQRLKFRYKVTSAFEPNDFEVLVSSAGVSPAAFTTTLIPLAQYDNTEYIESITNLTGITGPVNIAWHIPPGGLDGWQLFIDNVIIEAIPACPEPTNVVVSCLTTTGASFEWTPGGTETSWEVALVNAGDPFPTAGTAITSPTYTVETLNPETGYTFYVRAVCPNGAGFGSWVPVSITTPSISVLEAQGFCSNLESVIIFDNTFGGQNEDYGSVACLFSTPNPVWYYLKVDQPGDLNFSLIQNTAFDADGNPVGQGLDVDFVAFGPFASLTQACGEIELEQCPTCPNNTQNQAFYPFGNIVDCSYDGAFIESFTIPAAQTGEFYAVLITNFNGSQGQIKLEQLDSSTGSTDCNIIYNVALGTDKILCGATDTTLTASVDSPSGSGQPQFQWFEDGNAITPAVVSTTNTTQTVTIPFNDGAHIYSVIVTIADATNTEPITDTVSVTFGPEVIATEPQDYVICDTDTDGFAEFDLAIVNGEVLGTLNPANFTVSYFTTEGAANGNILPITGTQFTNTTPNAQTIYARVQSIAVPTCFDVVPVQLVVSTLPVVTLPATYATCDDQPVTLDATPFITGATYTWLLENVPVSGGTANTLVATEGGTYTLEVNLNGCVATYQTEVTVTPTPEFTLPSGIIVCNASPETLAVTGTNFDAATPGVTYSWTLNNGTPFADTSSIAVTQAGDYSVTVTVNNCSATQTVTVGAGTAPAVDDPADVASCTSYTLPVLGAGNYFTEPNGGGTALQAGSVINTTQTVYVYAASGTNCLSENSFVVTITAVPVIAITEECDGSNNYVLEVTFDEDANYTADNVAITWKNESGVVVGTDALLTITVKGKYTVTVVPDGASIECPMTGEVTVNDTSCMIQKGISPNNDGLNDSFDLSALDVRKLSIYNRYGTEVFTYGAYTNQWNGQGKGNEELPTGTYFYMIERQNGESKTGWIYINREE